MNVSPSINVFANTGTVPIEVRGIADADSPIVLCEIGDYHFTIFLTPSQARELSSAIDIALRELNGDTPDTLTMCSEGAATVCPPYQVARTITELMAGAHDEDATREERLEAAEMYARRFEDLVRREAPCATYYTRGDVVCCDAHARDLDLTAIYEQMGEEEA